MKKIIFITLSLLGLFILTPSYAVLDLELTKGFSTATPIAVMPFANEQNNVPGNTTLSTVITNDLNNSGQFKVVNNSLFAGNITNLSQIDFADWRKKQVDDIVIGQVQPTSGGQYQVSFQLVGVFTTTPEQAKQDPSKSVILSQSFVTNQAGLRRLAHHISDLIYQRVTGVRGVFNTQIAYVLVQNPDSETPKYSLVVSDVDGFNPRILLNSTSPIMSPDWSPNGKNLAYVSYENNHSNIYLQNVDTASRQILSQYPGMNNAPAFSPDGTKLALVLAISGTPKIYVMDLANRQVAQLTNGFSLDTEPSWAADSKKLLFTSDRGGTPQIYQYDFGSQQIQRLTFDGNYNARGSYAPDGQSIVMLHRETSTFSIAKEDLSSGQIQTLAESNDAESPSMAPNGKMVIYATRYNGRSVLGMVSVDGNIKIRLPASDGDVREPAWSPFPNG